MSVARSPSNVLMINTLPTIHITTPTADFSLKILQGVCAEERTDENNVYCNFFCLRQDNESNFTATVVGY